MRVLLPTMRDPGQIGGTSTHIDMLTRGLQTLGHEAHALYVGGTLPPAVRKAGLIWPAGVLNRMRTGWGMMYAAEARARLLARATARELAGLSGEGTEVSREAGWTGAEPGRAPMEARGTSAEPGGWAEKLGSISGTPWDVLNAQEVYPVPYLRAVADRFGVPLVLTLHGYPLYESVSEGYSAQSRMGLHYLMRAEMRTELMMTWTQCDTVSQAVSSCLVHSRNQVMGITRTVSANGTFPIPIRTDRD